MFSINKRKENKIICWVMSVYMLQTKEAGKILPRKNSSSIGYALKSTYSLLYVIWKSCSQPFCPSFKCQHELTVKLQRENNPALHSLGQFHLRVARQKGMAGCLSWYACVQLTAGVQYMDSSHCSRTRSESCTAAVWLHDAGP